MLTPEHNQHDSENINTRGSIFDHDYPLPVAAILTTITYTATLKLPFRFAWTVDNLLPLIRAHATHADINATPTALALAILLIPALFFFMLEFTVMRSYPPVSKAVKVLFITGIITSSILVGLISAPLA